jgi:hypothetical protein
MADRRSRESLVLARALAPSLAVAFAITGCAGQGSAPTSCTVPEECPASSRCLSGSCVANAPPRPALALPDVPLEAHVLLSFDGGESADPDEGDAVVAWRWSFRALTAPCAPPVVAGNVSRAHVRFACPGRYAADLTVTDTLALDASRTEEFEVSPLAGPALVEAGPDVALEHVCTALPTRCAPAGEVQLSATAPTLEPTDLSFEWTVEPPANRPLGDGRRVVFSPDALVPAPLVVIETDGEAVSGDWIFRVEVRDGAGVVGAAVTRVSVGNRPPVVQKTIPVPDHAFDGVQLTASGEVPFTISDPDGDSFVARAPEWRHAGDGEATFAGQLLAEPPRISFSIAVPWTSPGDALHLIGGEGLERAILFEVEDVNGGLAAEVWPIVVGNRPPVLVSQPGASTVDHLYDAEAQAYRAAVSLSTWSDPDGDPLWQVPGSETGAPDCPVVTVPDGSGGRVATAECVLPFSGVHSLANFVGLHVVAQRIQDPWAAAAATSTVTFTIGNRAPTVTSTADHVVSGSCSLAQGCCRSGPDECLAWNYDASAVSTTVPSRWADADGDPIDVRVAAHAEITAAQPLVCRPSQCALTLSVRPMLVCGEETMSLSTVITDGAGSTPPTALPVRRRCQPF